MPRRRKSNEIEEDPVVEEIRVIRRKMWEEGGGTGEGYLRVMKERSRARKRNKIKGRSRRRKSA